MREPSHAKPLRKIIHIDMDAFYASVEQRDEPCYRGKPIAVGGTPEERGTVATASYEARKFGIHSAMPSRLAQQKCRHLVFVKPRFEVYREISAQIREIFHRYTDRVEPVALDEAYLDVTENKPGIPSAIWIAQAIKTSICEETGLTASAGVSVNKFLAKMASGINKPNGLCLISPQEAEPFIEQLPIEKFHGIGQVTAEKMHKLGIFTGADLRQQSELELVRHFGKMGQFFYHIARAQDDRPVNPNRVRKSIGVETSFAADLDGRTEVLAELAKLVPALKERMERQQAQGRTLTLKVKYANYQQITRSKTVGVAFQDEQTIAALADDLLQLTELDDRKIRLLGLAVSGLRHRVTVADTPLEQYEQLTLNV